MGVRKEAESHRERRTRAMASEKVGAGLAYQAAVRIGQLAPGRRWSVNKVMNEKRPKRRGVVR